MEGNRLGRVESVVERGLIDDPKNKNKSVIFTEEGLALARASAERLFSSEPHR
jgi:hypothetical protein